MNWTVVQRILGILLMMFSITMLPPIVISLIFDDHAWVPFVESFGLTFAAGLLVWLPVHRVRKELRLRDGFLVVAASSGPCWARSARRRCISQIRSRCR